MSMKHHWSAPPSILPPPASASASRQPWHAVTAAGDGQGTGGGEAPRAEGRTQPAPLCPPDGFGCAGYGAPSPLPRVTEPLSTPALSTAQCRGSSALPNADDSNTALCTGAAWHYHMHTTMPGSSGCFSALPLPAHGSQRGACHGFIITCKLAGTKGAARTTLLTAPPSKGCCGVSVETLCVRRSTQVAELAQKGSPAGAWGHQYPSQSGATPKEKCLAGCPPCILAQICPCHMPHATLTLAHGTACMRGQPPLFPSIPFLLIERCLSTRCPLQAEDTGTQCDLG